MTSPAHRSIGPALVGWFTLFIIGLALPQTSDAAVYKWRDDKGKLHFTDQPYKIPKQYQKKHGKPVYGSIPQKTSLSSSGSKSSGSSGPGDFSAFNSYGQKVSITVKDNTVLFAMATWCPYSKKLVRFLKDPSVSGKMKDLELVFIFHDEWPYIKKQLDKSVMEGQLSQRQADRQLQRMKEKAKGEPVYNRGFLNDLPGKHYFATDAAPKLNRIFPGSIPRAYSPSNKNFGHGISKWIHVQFQDEEDKRDYLMAEFKKYNKGQK